VQASPTLLAASVVCLLLSGRRRAFFPLVLSHATHNLLSRPLSISFISPEPWRWLRAAMIYHDVRMCWASNCQLQLYVYYR
jgi:hypothetical protein